MFRRLIFAVMVLAFGIVPAGHAEILISPTSDQTEIYAAQELQRYFYQLTGTRLPMTRRIRAVFAAAIPAAQVKPGGLEYYIEASDGDNVGVFPVTAPAQACSILVENAPGQIKPIAAPEIEAKGPVLRWKTVKNAFVYRIYRSQNPHFEPGPDNYLTYVAADVPGRFEDNGEDFAGLPLQGSWYYQVTAIDRAGYESPPSPAVPVQW